MDKLPVLFLTVCSHTKKGESEIFQYTSKESISEELDRETSKELLYRRKKNLDILKEDELYRNGKKIKYLPSNSMLSYTRDICFVGEMNGYFLPAINRYIGRFYQQLGNSPFELINNSNVHILIISTLYGVVKPCELIQYYSLSINDSPRVVENWQEDDFLSHVVLEYVQKYKIQKIIEIIGDDEYKKIINWADLREILGKKVFHAYSKEYFSPDVLMPLGDFLHICLNTFGANDYDKYIIEGGSIPTKYEDVFFTTNNLPTNRKISNENIVHYQNAQLFKDNIRRMKANLTYGVIKLFNAKKIDLPSDKKGLGYLVVILHNRNILSYDTKEDIYKFLKTRNKIDYDHIQINESRYCEMYHQYDRILKDLTRIYQKPITNLEKLD